MKEKTYICVECTDVMCRLKVLMRQNNQELPWPNGQCLLDKIHRPIWQHVEKAEKDDY